MDESSLSFRRLTSALFLLVALVVALFFVFYPNSGREASDGNDISLPKLIFSDGTTVSIEIADSNESRLRGLSDRESLAEDAGLLFIFPLQDYYGIWMKEMKFPIDIIWLDENYSVVDIKSRALPESFPEVFSPRALALYVLEVNANFASNHDIKIGDTARLSI